MGKIRFLTMAEIMIIYEDQIRRYGGQFGMRDIALLSSALALPESTYDKKYLHKTIPEMACAYAYHISENHPFIDGNKRTALASALVFLDLNGYEFTSSDDDVYKTMMLVAKGQLKKEQLSDFFKTNSIKNKG
jgi:death on curing protein